MVMSEIRACVAGCGRPLQRKLNMMRASCLHRYGLRDLSTPILFLGAADTLGVVPASS